MALWAKNYSREERNWLVCLAFLLLLLFLGGKALVGWRKQNKDHTEKRFLHDNTHTLWGFCYPSCLTRGLAIDGARERERRKTHLGFYDLDQLSRPGRAGGLELEMVLVGDLVVWWDVGTVG